MISAQMSTVVVQRRFETAISFERLDAVERAVAWCMEQHRVRFLHSYLSLDGRSMVCIYSAPDVEAVRETQRQAGLPVTRLWAARLLGSTGRHHAPPGLSNVVVEREFSEPVSTEAVEQLRVGAAECLATNGAELLESKLSLDGTRMLCVYAAPDAESVRRVNRTVGAPFDVAWTATFHPG